MRNPFAPIILNMVEANKTHFPSHVVRIIWLYSISLSLIDYTSILSQFYFSTPFLGFVSQDYKINIIGSGVLWWPLHSVLHFPVWCFLNFQAMVSCFVFNKGFQAIWHSAPASMAEKISELSSTSMDVFGWYLQNISRPFSL